MAQNLEAVKSPSFAKQKVESQGKKQWEDVYLAGISRVKREAGLQPSAVLGATHRYLELLSRPDIVEGLKTNTRCKQHFCEQGKRLSDVSLSDVGPGQKGPLSSMQSPDVAVEAAKETIVWALEHYMKKGRLPETGDQKKRSQKQGVEAGARWG